MRNKLLVSLLLGAILSAGMLYLAFRNVPLTDLAAYLHTFNYVWLIPTIVLVVLTFVLRVVRWQLILNHAQQLDFAQAFHPLMIGFMMNCVLPGRVGELARPIILHQRNKVPLTTGLATVAAERLFDVAFLLILFAFVFNNISKQSDLEVVFGQLHLNSQTLQTIAWTMIRLIMVLMVGLALVLMSWSRRLMVRVLDRMVWGLGTIGPGARHRAERVAHLCKKLLDNVAIGLSLVRTPKRMAACMAMTVLIWGFSLLSYYVFALGCPDMALSMVELMTVMVVICFFIALPSVPGYWGLWEAGGVFALSLFGVAANEAAGFTLVNHAVQLLPVILIGWISALATSIDVWHISKNKNRMPDISSPRSKVDTGA